jgi:hypothetical protein
MVPRPPDRRQPEGRRRTSSSTRSPRAFIGGAAVTGGVGTVVGAIIGGS